MKLLKLLKAIAKVVIQRYKFALIASVGLLMYIPLIYLPQEGINLTQSQFETVVNVGVYSGIALIGALSIGLFIISIQLRNNQIKEMIADIKAEL